MFRFLKNIWSAVNGAGDNGNGSQRAEPENMQCELVATKPLPKMKPPLADLKPVSVNLPLPEDLIILILSFVPPDDLTSTCVYIKEWKHLIEGQSLWCMKCEREGKRLPRIRPRNIPEHFYRDIYFARLSQNLLKNNCGKDAMNHWDLVLDERMHYHGDEKGGWEIEVTPNGAELVPDTDCQYCFSTTFYWCRKNQLIDLYDEGFTPALLEALTPKIHVSEWYCARFDCGSEYELDVSLLDSERKELDHFHFYHKEEQWTGKEWAKVEHTFVDYPTNLQYINFVHSGKDTQYWAGNYGSKMAEGSVILYLQ